MTNPDLYFEYLRGRSWRGWLYRRFYLYPRLSRFLKGRALDVGCGLGDLLAFRPDTVGVDINKRAVEWCRGRGLEVLLTQPDSLPFEEESFDSASLDNVLEHLADPSALLGEIRRVLKSEGVLVVGVPGRKGFAGDLDHKIFYDERLLLETMAQAGFRKRETFFMPFRWNWLDGHARQYCLYGVFEKPVRTF